MLDFLKNLFGFGPKIQYHELIAQGAQIIDVRTPAEFKTGHVKGSINIPVQLLSQKLHSLKNQKPVITCCASGTRSALAKNILQSNGFKEVYNAGSWGSLRNQLNQNSNTSW